ncbi:hypothetical protein SPRG_16223 [Saprolegnia parasitica CBS 223.65]|uniref:Amino acid transporter n=1 Tax=Saprolegnia parasitica (strain CBS 223.65) TaxID=695850 RepID=A0A067BVW9_SAPPC|nr:hypothetical protein SPRG_16223 [Saprolegnia parasitica CBS 223.65]KDO18446.1 hypothetical protein SPRG_16223 [Saprolegnia parasitica CBS 223.65]|eukprot:XP_012210848.1 hypothetical protein SPRG_16223 [Saprolegnia parasitica CBS 223.65]
MSGNQGIYLYQEADHQVTPTPPHLLHATPSSASSTSSGGKRTAPHHEPLGIRTNFMTPARHELGPHTPEYEFPDPIMEETEKLPIGSNFDPRLGANLVSSLSILIGVGVGVGLGIGLKALSINKDTMLWLALPGDLFVRALRCLIVPMVFCTMTVAIAEIAILKNTALLSWRTAGTYFLTSFLAAVQGTLVAITYHGLVARQDNATTFNTASTVPIIALQCANGKYLGPSSIDGSVACTGVNASSAQFQVTDVNNALTISTPLQTLSLTQQVIAIIEMVVPDNIFHALAAGSLLSIIMFALPLGIAVAKSHAGDASANNLLNMLRQARNALLILIHIVLRFTPIAIVFLISSAVVAYDTSSAGLAAHGGYLLLAFVAGVVSHVLIVLPIVLFLFTRSNPYNYLRQLFPAYVFAFGCASSMATLPVAVTVTHQTRLVTRSMAQLIMCLGTPINMNAAGLYQPIMTIFMLHMSGNASALGTPQIVVLFFVSLIGSMGTAPVPNAGLVMLMTVWKTVFPTIALPSAFVYVVAIDFLFDRIRTAVNVNGNMVVTRILSAQYDDTISLDGASTPVAGW